MPCFIRRVVPADAGLYLMIVVVGSSSSNLKLVLGYVLGYLTVFLGCVLGYLSLKRWVYIACIVFLAQ